MIVAAPTLIRVAYVYLSISTEEQDLARQEAIVEGARAAGGSVANLGKLAD